MTLSDYIVLLVSFTAAVTDITRGKVYNKLTYPAALSGLLLAAVVKSLTFAQSITGLLSGFLLYLLIHQISGLGFGDVKLMAAIGALKGFPFVLYSTFYILCIGSAIGILVLAWRGRLFPSLKWVCTTVIASMIPGFQQRPLKGSMTTMPFAPVIFLGIVYCIYLEAARGPLVVPW